MERFKDAVTSNSKTIVVFLLIISALVLFMTKQAYDSMTTQDNANQSYIDDLNKDIDSLSRVGAVNSGDGGQTGTSGEDGSSSLSAMRAVGDSVAEEQNKFAVLINDNTVSAGDGAPTTGEEQVMEQQRMMESFFNEGTYVLSDEELYSLTTTMKIGDSEIDPRMPWYIRSESYGGYTWSTVSVVPTSSDLTTVMWLCRDDSNGELLAWASADWSSSAASFVHLTVGTTALGDQQSRAGA